MHDAHCSIIEAKCGAGEHALIWMHVQPNNDTFENFKVPWNKPINYWDTEQLWFTCCEPLMSFLTFHNPSCTFVYSFSCFQSSGDITDGRAKEET